MFGVDSKLDKPASINPNHIFFKPNGGRLTKRNLKYVKLPAWSHIDNVGLDHILPSSQVSPANTVTKSEHHR